MQNNIKQDDKETISAFPLIVWMLTGSIGLIGSNSLALGPIAPSIAASFGTEIQQVMLASAAFGLGTALGALALGQVIDRVGPRRTLAYVMVIMAFGFFGCGVANGTMGLVASQFLVGLSAGVALPAIYTLAAVVALPGHEGRTIGIVLTGWTISMVAGVPLSTLIADSFGWRMFYFMIAAAALAAGLGMFLNGRKQEQRAGAAAGSPVTALAIKGVLPLLAACACFMAAFYGVYAYVGNHLHVNLAYPVRANGLAAVFYGLGFGSAVFLDRHMDAHSGRHILLPLLFLVVALVFVLMALLSGSYIGMLAVMAIWGLANHFGLNVLIMRLTALEPSQRGAIMGLNSAVTYLALFAGTITMGKVHAAEGFVFLALCGAVLSLLASAFALFAARAQTGIRASA
ncbi:MFS transporter [Phyllobacterium sp. K27]